MLYEETIASLLFNIYAALHWNK